MASKLNTNFLTSSSVSPFGSIMSEPAAAGSELCAMTATEMLANFRNKNLSPVEVCKAVFDQIRTRDGEINAFCALNEDAAFASARGSEARWQKGVPQGALDGVPVAIKDLILTKGLPTRRGSLTVDVEQAWDVDAPVTQRLLEAGAVMVGKTTSPEFGWRATTDSTLCGITRNPINTALTPGGSSGGSAAAVAANMVPLAVGTDGGGSIRIPAAFTGTVGIKGQYGRVPAFPLSPMGNVAHLGPHARNVADAALLLRVMALPDSRDWTALAPPPKGWLKFEAAQRDMQGLKIAYSPNLGYVDYVAPEIANALNDAVQTCIGLGAIVEQPELHIPNSREAFCILWFSAARQFAKKLTSKQFDSLDIGLQAMVNHAETFTLSDYLDAQALRADLATRLSVVFDQYDVLLTPATAVLPFEAGVVNPVHARANEFLPDDWTWWAPFSFPFNLTQQPAMVQNCAWVDAAHSPGCQLPVGMQWVAAKHREDMMVAAAAAFEAARK
jgi:aspartyl-tRNA(Asn)/glutamyl-tRNA(Gln) amidotransferase subunit A